MERKYVISLKLDELKAYRNFLKEKLAHYLGSGVSGYLKLKIDELEGYIKYYEKNPESFSVSDDQIDNLNEEIEILKNNIEQIIKERDSYKMTIAFNNSQIGNLRQELSKAWEDKRQKIAFLESENKELTEQRDYYKALCIKKEEADPTRKLCEDIRINEFRKRIRDLNDKIASLEEELKSVRKDLYFSISSHTDKSIENDNLNKRLQELERLLTKKDEKIKEYHAKLEEVETSIREFMR